MASLVVIFYPETRSGRCRPPFLSFAWLVAYFLACLCVSGLAPKNILMIGPTGCGKTEIARRLAKLADAPFVKVEATKYTEVGFHGRDVDEMIRDLVEASITLTRKRLRKQKQSQVTEAVENKILDILTGEGTRAHHRKHPIPWLIFFSFSLVCERF